MTTEAPLERAPAVGDWRDGAAAVAVLTFGVVAETPVLAHGPQYAKDLSVMSHQAYGLRIGLPRILSLLGAFELEATFFVCGSTAEHWPAAVESIVMAGHEVALHGHAYRRLPRLTSDEQRADFEQGHAALTNLGVNLRGYRAPYLQQTRVTLDLAAEAGLVYDSSLMDDDKPYRMRTSAGALAELPVHWALDDWHQYAYLPEPDLGGTIETPGKVLGLWTSELDAMRETGSLCVINAHPFLSGRPSRIRTLDGFVRFAREAGDVKFMRADRVAETVLGIFAG